MFAAHDRELAPALFATGVRTTIPTLCLTCQSPYPGKGAHDEMAPSLLERRHVYRAKVRLTTAADPDTAGLVFSITAVDPFFHEQQANIAFTGQPRAIPGNGRWVAAKDVSCHGLYFADIE